MYCVVEFHDAKVLAWKRRPNAAKSVHTTGDDAPVNHLKSNPETIRNSKNRISEMAALVPVAFTRPQKDFKQPCQFQNVDAQDHYVELHAYMDPNFSVETKIESIGVQSVPTLRKRPVQTNLISQENMGTQYEPSLFSKEELDSIVESHDFASFLTNVEGAVIHGLDSNICADPEYAMKPDEEEYDARGQSTLPEVQALSHAKYSRGKVISSITYSTIGKLTLVFMAVTPPGWRNVGHDSDESAALDEEAGNGALASNEYNVLVWNIADNMTPLAILVSPSPVTCMHVHPQRNGLVLLAGTYSGSILVYDLDSYYATIYTSIFAANYDTGADTGLVVNQESLYNGRNVMTFTQSVGSSQTPQKFYPSVTVSLSAYHTLPVTDVKWLPHASQIFRNGELQTSASPLGALQFASVSPDGFVKLWSLQCVDRDPTRSDLTVLVPFLTLPMATMYPHVVPLKPVTITFPGLDNPSTMFIIGDAFGNLACSTWPVAVACMQSLEEDKRRMERDMLTVQDPDANLTFYQDRPTKGSCISANRYSVSSIFHLEYSLILSNMLFAASADGCRVWLIDKPIHVQAADIAEKGILDEQTVLKTEFAASERSGFVTIESPPSVYSQYSIGDNLKISQYIDTSLIVTSLGLNPQGASSSVTLESNITDLMSNRKIVNMVAPVVKSVSTDFPNFNFYESVFNFTSTEGSITAACLSRARGGVLIIGNDRGVVSVFDLVDRMHEPLLSLQICVGPVTKMQYVRQAVLSGVSLSSFAQASSSSSVDAPSFGIPPGKIKTKTRDVLLVGDVHGTIHVLEIPRTLKAKVPHERSALRYKFRRCLESSHYINWRASVRQRSVEELKALSDVKAGETAEH